MEDNIKYDNLKGIILNLFKRKLLPAKADLHLYDAMLFGYHDGIVFTHPEVWSDFGPDGVDKLLGQSMTGRSPDWESLFSEIYPVKLLFPRERCRQSMTSAYGFDFAYWEKGATQDQPLFAALLLNVTRQFVVYTSQQKEATNDHRLSVVADSIWKAIQSLEGDNIRQELESMHCGLFQCIGYYDYALLFGCKDWNLVYRIADKLKSWRLCSKKGEGKDEHKISFLSSNYLLLGMGSQDNAWVSIADDAKCEMSIQINLRESCSVEGFRQAFLKQLETRIADVDSIYQQKCRNFWQNKVRFYQINGGADCIMLTDTQGMKFLLREFSKGGMLTPAGNAKNCFFNRHISSIQTSARRLLGSTGDTEVHEAISSGEQVIHKQTVQNLYLWVDRLRKADFIRRDEASSRQAHSLQRLLAQYENLIGENHVFDICAVLQPAYESLNENLDRLSRNLTFPCQEQFEPEQAMRLKERIHTLLNEFHSKLGAFQDSLQISDPHFIEGVRINHPSIGSSTKLLLTFSHLLNGFAKEVNELIRKQDKDWNSCTHHFLLSCGGCDRARAWNLSEGIQSSQSQNNRHDTECDLIIMRMPERSLLDIQGTLLRSLHELWHFCGHRKRTYRCSCIIQDAAERMAAAITTVLPVECLYPDMLLQFNTDYQRMSREQQKQIYAKLQGQLDAYRQKMIQNIAKAIATRVEDKKDACVPEDKDDFYYGKQIFELLKNITVEIFVRRDDTEDALWKTIYHCYQEQIRVLYRTFTECLKSTLVEDILWKMDYWEKNGQVNRNIVDNIQAVLYYMAGNTYTNGGDWENCIKNDILAVTYDTLSQVYREAFSDNMACCTTQCQMEEYIMGFVYEIPDIASSLCKYENRDLRIGVILEHRFGCRVPETVDGEVVLAELDRGRLEKAYLETFGVLRSKETDEIVDRIVKTVNALWAVYVCNRQHVQNLIEYLKNTEAVHGLDGYVPKYCQTIRQIYQKARTMDTHEQVMDVMQELLQAWSWMAEES